MEPWGRGEEGSYLKSEHLKSRFKDRISNGLVSKGLALGIAMASTIQNPDIMSGFKTVFDSMAAICWILIGLASRFQISFDTEIGGMNR